MNNNNNMKDTSSKKQGKSSVSNGVSDYTYNPRVENPNPKATTNNISKEEKK